MPLSGKADIDANNPEANKNSNISGRDDVIIPGDYINLSCDNGDDDDEKMSDSQGDNNRGNDEDATRDRVTNGEW
ncbi:uncharacterized protein FTOL_01064 [Fusarium torulosum]|uniref:Uncharacterized protein n=1 Tax=Fusarium torulosum TaxID=33205 RepID=A0AAE8LZ86_9HYPO|nr:uncharacterized protein FTOL_01064 [Fusarium torulosum]